MPSLSAWICSCCGKMGLSFSVHQKDVVCCIPGLRLTTVDLPWPTMKFFILMVLKKSSNWIFLCTTGLLCHYKIYLVTSNLIEKFVNDWWFNWKFSGIVKMLEIVWNVRILRHFLSSCWCTTFFWDRQGCSANERGVGTPPKSSYFKKAWNSF